MADDDVGVHALLDAVVAYLPEPKEKLNVALDVGNDETETLLASDSSAPLVGLAFKLEQAVPLLIGYVYHR